MLLIIGLAAWGLRVAGLEITHEDDALQGHRGINGAVGLICVAAFLVPGLFAFFYFVDR